MIIDLHNGVSGVVFRYGNAGEVIDFIADRVEGGNPYSIMQYYPKLNAYVFGKTKHVITDGMYIVHVKRYNHFLLTGSDNWIREYNV